MDTSNNVISGRWVEKKYPARDAGRISKSSFNFIHETKKLHEVQQLYPNITYPVNLIVHVVSIKFAWD